MPKVSVIIPNYNHAKYLRQRIESILNQTYSDFEMICMDDASDDESVSVIEEYKDLSNFQIVINSENSGSPFIQWNRGVAVAKGEFVWIAESDDFANEKFLEEMVPVMERNDSVGIVVCKSYKVDPNGNVVAAWEDWVSSGKTGKWNNDFVINGRSEALNFIYQGNFLPNASALLLRKSIYQRVGMANEDMRRAGDMMMWAKMLMISDLAYRAKSLNYYRSHDESVRKRSAKIGLRFEEITKVLMFLVEQLDLGDNEKIAALNTAADMWANGVFSKSGGRIPLHSTKKIFQYASRHERTFPIRALSKLGARPCIKGYKYLRRRWLKKSSCSVPIQQLTADKYHWFGYYDKLQFDPSSRYVLSMQSCFENRIPTSNDIINIGIIDTSQNNHWINVGTTKSWCWQQGCMLQWLPATDSKIIWNDREGEVFVSRIFDLDKKDTQTVNSPVYAIHPGGKRAVTLNFSRINDMRPGYGYAGAFDPNSEINAPEDCGIYTLDLTNGRKKLILSLAEVVKLGGQALYSRDAKHYFNHLLFNPSGTRFIFLHRWKEPGSNFFGTRMLTANEDGTDIRILDEYNKVSHFIWRDDDQILAWAWRPDYGAAFYMYNDSCGDVVPVGLNVMTKNGHCSYLPDSDWIINDTYPDDLRIQKVYLYNQMSGQRRELGRFFSPLAYEGQFRCDAHPRVSPDGKKVVIDGTFRNEGRQQYMLDISSIV